MRLFRNTCLIFAILIFASCGDHIMYHSYHHISNQGWGKNDTIPLSIAITDTLPGTFQALLLVRNLGTYPYQNMLVAVRHNFPDTTSWQTDTISFTLADKDGKWKGSGWGGLYQTTLPLRIKSTTAHPGNYTFKVSHLMTDPLLKGINDIGILVKKEIPE